ncbi:NUDIX domain-containing protein [Chloroflexota bacterium]
MLERFYGIRDRATAIVQRDERLLIVRDRGFRHYSLPGGGVNRGESPEGAVARELAEETGLRAVSVSPLLRCKTSDVFNTYLVYLVEATGELRVNRLELSEALWWDGQARLPFFGYVRHVLAQLDWPNTGTSGILTS